MAQDSHPELHLRLAVKSQDALKRTRTAYPFNLSADSIEYLQAAVQTYWEYFRTDHSQVDIADICYTAACQQGTSKHRASFACTSIENLSEHLEKANVSGFRNNKRTESVVFVFSSQGGSHVGMGKELMETSNFFRDTFMSCDEFLQSLGFPSTLGVFQKGNADSILSGADDHMIMYHCACVILEYALARLYMWWGLCPTFVLGHSLGEYTALAISGAISIEDALRLVANRARLMTANCVARTSGMLWCRLPATEVERLISNSDGFLELTTACHNSPEDCVIAGSLNQIEAFRSHCSTAGIAAGKVEVPYAFHSPFMDPAVKPMQELGFSVQFLEPKIPIFSSVFGRLMTLKDLNADYFASHTRMPVHFVPLIQQLVSTQKSCKSTEMLDDMLFIEIGPHPIILPMIRATVSLKLSTRPYHYLASLRKGSQAWSSISESLCQIYLAGVPLDWHRVFDGTEANEIEGLPLLKQPPA